MDDLKGRPQVVSCGFTALLLLMLDGFMQINIFLLMIEN